MNPHHNSNQNPVSTSAVQQVYPVMNQQMFNGNTAGLFPNNMPFVAPPGFPSQPFPMHNATGQLPNGIRGFNPQQNIIPFPVNQFNPSQQQQVQFFAHNSMNPTAYGPSVGLPNEQALVQSTIQNIYQLLQLQNSNYAQCPPGSFPMFQNQMVNVMNPQNPGFPVNQQFGMSSANAPVQHANNGPQNMGQQFQGNPFLPGASGSVQTQQPQNLLTNFQNHIPQGVGPQNQNFFTQQMFGIANMNGPMQNVSQGQPGFVPPMMDVNASRPIVNTGQTHNPSPALTNDEGDRKNVLTNVNGWTESQHKNFTAHKTYDHSHNGSMSHKHANQTFGNHKGHMNTEGGSYSEVDSVSRNSTNFEKKVPSLNYTEQEIKEWRASRKRNYPTNAAILEKHKKEQALADVTNQEAVLRRQQLKEILAKQAELGCEVAEIPASYFSTPDKQNPRERKHERHQHNKKGRFHNKRRTSYQDANRITKNARPRDQGNHQTKPYKREPSLLQKLLTRDIKRDKTHILQVLRFMTANSFFIGESLTFPSVIVRETNADVPSIETGESLTFPSVIERETTADVPYIETTCSVIKVEEEEEEGEIID